MSASFIDQPAGWYVGAIVGARDCDDVTGLTTQTPIDEYSLSVEPGAPANVVVELHWPDEWLDLDAVMTGPMGFSDERFFMNFGNRGSLDAIPYAWYATDSPAEGSPPEYVQLSRQMDGVYRFYAYVSPGVPEGIAVLVRVLIDGAVVQEFNLTTTAQTHLGGGVFEGNNLWEVFELSGTTITAIDTYSHCDGSTLESYLGCFQ